MKFIILFEDTLDADPGIRKTHMPEHLDFLKKHANTILAAGPLTDAEKQGRNGLWIVEAGSKDAVDRLVHEDPFWPTGLRKSYSIIEWHQVFADGSPLICLE